MREEKRGERVDEICGGILRRAKGTVGQDVGAVFVVEQFGGFALEFIMQDIISLRQRGAKRREALRDQVIRRGWVRARDLEDVLGAEGREAGYRQGEGCPHQQSDGERRAHRQGDYGFSLLVVCCLRGVAPEGLVEADCFGEEHWPEEDEEGLDTDRWSC